MIPRMYSRILKNLIEEDIDHEPGEQARFQVEKSTSDNHFTLKIILKKQTHRKRQELLTFIDPEKACDNVLISQLLKAIKKLVVGSILINTSKCILESELQHH